MHESLTLPVQPSGYVFEFTHISTQEDIFVTIYMNYILEHESVGQ